MKSEVFEILYDRVRTTKRPWLVTSDDVKYAIIERNRRHSGQKKELKTNNPANFLKDFIRKTTCNKNWPERLKRARITARQRYGSGLVFEFVDFRAGDEDPFPDRYDPDADTRIIEVESLSIPRTARALGRKDEAWLIQVLVNQRIANTHFAVVSKHDTVEFTHIQMSVKTQPEIDAIFTATVRVGRKDMRALVTCEAKQRGERLLENQIREQVKQAFSLTKKLNASDRIDTVIPVAVKVVDLVTKQAEVRGIHFLEFEMVERGDFENLYQGDALYNLPLNIESSALYVMRPEVKGVS